jgi:hypothetical protein
MFLLAFQRTVLHWYDEKFDLLHFYQPIKRQNTTEETHWLIVDLIVRSVEGRNFHHTSLPDRKPEET